MLQIVQYDSLPTDATAVRTDVFVNEQGFAEEFDTTDAVATHFVAYEKACPIGTCRVFETDSGYVLGRLCVKKANRGRGVGTALVIEAEQYVQSVGGARLRLHSQCHAMPFYEALSYVPCSEIEEEQGCPHIWMEKVFTV